MPETATRPLIAPMTEILPNLHAVFRAMAIARARNASIVFDATRAQIDRPETCEAATREVTNLGWLLRHAGDVEDFTVSTRARAFNGRDWPNGWHAATLAARTRGGKVYATPFASADLLADWLDRPRFRGLVCSWDHTPYVIGA
jgi:hypothetical protein